MPKETKLPEGIQGAVIGSAKGASGNLAKMVDDHVGNLTAITLASIHRTNSKRSPHYKGTIKQKDNGCEAVYDT